MALLSLPRTEQHASIRSGPGSWLASAVRALPLWFVLVVDAGLIALYFVVLHPWLMNWGSSSAEQYQPLPGDEAVADPAVYFTRAITINAPADKVWPWLVQIGQDRAGFYSNDWLENLFGGDIHNLNEIRPEWQQRQIGDRVPMAPRAYLGGGLGDATTTRIRLLIPGRAIADTPGRFVVEPIDAQTTRLFVRESISANRPEGSVGATVSKLTWDPIHFVMVQRMLRGIAERVEERPLVPTSLQLVARLGWTLAALGLAVLFLRRRRGFLWLLIPVAAIVPSLVSTRDLNSGIAGFLAVGITLLGALSFGRCWWPAFTWLVAAVLLVLLLAPDAYTAFGLAFAAIVAIQLGGWLGRRRERTARLSTTLPHAA